MQSKTLSLPLLMINAVPQSPICLSQNCHWQSSRLPRSFSLLWILAMGGEVHIEPPVGAMRFWTAQMRRPGTYKLPISTHWPPRSEVSSQVEALRVSLQVSFQAHSGHGLGTLPLNETSGLAKLSEDRHEGQYNLRQST